MLTGIQMDNVLREIILIVLKINFEESPTMIQETEINVLALVDADKTVSLRQIASELNINHKSVSRILHKHKYKSFKYHLHQHLYEDDAGRTMEYCNWILRNNVLSNNNFLGKILFSDESRFTNLGMFNRQNTRYWSQEIQHLIREGNFQQRFGFNVWLGIIGTRIICTIIFEGPLTGPRYLRFLQNEIEDILEEQDGAPPHNSRIVIDYLQQRFGQNVISTNGTVRWLPRSPDLTPLDFFVWVHLKNIVYATPVTTCENLEHAIINITAEQLENVLRDVAIRVKKCIIVNGQHVEN
ncbi:hypothetical protein NQ315_011009 [Exocentrus adspersus]|uniref:Transposase n=1 Tax=Exocentrus adspersus TaxID=1586481 RepID=A0AAV8VJI0_9CUCU|nr:hypothetical protein NQ315_011009 [Exocentrus adspersus]